MIKNFSDEPTAGSRGLQIWLILTGKAQSRQTVTYGMLADALGFEGAGVLGRLLGHVLFFCQANELPPLTVLVVNQETGRPGEGFIGVDDLDVAREKVFQHNWYDVQPPSIKQLEDAYEAAAA